jgi:hypothetical protein
MTTYSTGSSGTSHLSTTTRGLYRSGRSAEAFAATGDVRPLATDHLGSDAAWCRRSARRAARGPRMDARRVGDRRLGWARRRLRDRLPPRQDLGRVAARVHTAAPGDELVTGRRFQTTHAVTIDAPPERVWPWLVQMGWGRAGWYTYRWVDLLLFPANGPSADRIVPELQDLAEGDLIPDGPPEADCAFTVVRCEPARTLLLFSDSHLFGSLAEREDVTMAWAWSWQLDPLPGGGPG